MKVLKKVLEKCGIFKSANITEEIDKDNSAKVIINTTILTIVIILFVKVILLLF